MKIIPKRGGQVLWSITLSLKPFMSPYRLQYRIRKCISSCKDRQQFKKVHSFLNKDLLLILRAVSLIQR